MLKHKSLEKTYTINEVMEATGFTRRTIMSHIKQKKLRTFKIGTEVKIKKNEFDKYMSTIKPKKSTRVYR